MAVDDHKLMADLCTEIELSTTTPPSPTASPAPSPRPLRDDPKRKPSITPQAREPASWKWDPNERDENGYPTIFKKALFRSSAQPRAQSAESAKSAAASVASANSVAMSVATTVCYDRDGFPAKASSEAQSEQDACVTHGLHSLSRHSLF